ncbi:MAG: DUF3467 domain-containing protein [Pirellulaceae bacterium]
MTSYHPEDRPDPSEQPIRARVPEHVSGGAFSTGVIVMTAQTEFILDFVQNLGRPHQIVARVIMPHHVLPQLVDALHRNMDLYRGRWGELPHTPGHAMAIAEQRSPAPSTGQDIAAPATQGIPGSGTQIVGASGITSNGESPVPAAPSPRRQADAAGEAPPASNAGPSNAGPSDPFQLGNEAGGAESPPVNETPGSGPQIPPGARQASAQEIYDDLKIRDELLSGAYANAVMIGHGPHEFSFDFITNFYPHSAVSARVFLAAGQVPRLYDSLKGTWEQLRQRLKPPGTIRPWHNQAKMSLATTPATSVRRKSRPA